MAEQPDLTRIREKSFLLPETFLDENRLLLICLSVHFLICGVVAFETGTWVLWLIVGVPALSFPAWLVRQYPAAFLARLVISTSAMIFTLLVVQQTGGYMEAHFSFFVMITAIAVYRDWRLLIFASMLIIIHHITFTIFDPLAVGFYAPGDSFGAWRHVLSHLSVGLMQVFALCYLTVLLRRREAQLAALGSSLDRATELATHDHLTGLFNRNHLESVVARLSPQVEGGIMPAVVCVLDLDHFKSINDRFGHLVGDDVLRFVAKTIQQQIRSNDCAFRQGGEEFLVILPWSTVEDGFHFAERVRKSVSSQLIYSFDAQISVTISIGLALWVQSQTFKQTFKLSDQALYEAKNNGRNQVKISRGSDLTCIVGSTH